MSGDFQHQWEEVRFGAELRENGEIRWYTLPALCEAGGVAHGFSARTGGVSTGYFDSLNLSFTRDEDVRENVMQNYRLFAAAAGFPAESMVMDAYEHGATVRQVTRADCGRGWTREPLPPCDGLITDDPEVTLITGHADCMAFYVYDPATHAIGLAHAGWRGALARIGAETVRAMAQAYGARPEDMLAGVGPGICRRCFEVGADVAEQFDAAFPNVPCISEDIITGKPHVDLWKIAAAQFFEAGIQPQNVSIMGVCTCEDKLLYSHRRDHGNTGGMAAFLRLKETRIR